MGNKTVELSVRTWLGKMVVRQTWSKLLIDLLSSVVSNERNVKGN